MKYISKRNLLILLFILLFIAFSSSIINLYNKTLVEYIFSQVETKSIWLDTILVILAIFIIFTYLKMIVSDRYLNVDVIVIFAIIFSFYLYFRASENYTFYSFTFSNHIYHWDVLFFLYGYIAISITNKSKEKRPPSRFDHPFLVDEPLPINSLPIQDPFGFTQFAKKLAIKLQSKIERKSHGSLAISILGEWGSGKTSFLNLVKRFIERDRIVIDFHPWESTSPQKIITDFFDTLGSALKPLDPRLEKNITSYAKTLVDSYEHDITKGISALLNVISQENEKNDYYDVINSSINRSKKQIIVFIDDLDRLDKKEIIEVLRLIRNTASFESVVYIVSFEREYVEEAIKTINKHNHKSYLSKIFQFEYVLPFRDPVILRSILKESFSELPEIKKKYLYGAIDLKFMGERCYIEDVIKNPRDIYRFLNLFNFDYDFVVAEVHIKDFFLLELIKFNFPHIYDQLRLRRSQFFFQRTDKQGKLIFTLKKVFEEHLPDGFPELPESTPKSDVEDSKSVFENWLEKMDGIKDDQKNFITSILNEVLSEKDIAKEDQSEFNNAFRFPGNFGNYFKLALDKYKISAGEFEIFRRTDLYKYSKQVLKWIAADKFQDLLDRLSNIQKFQTVNEYENHVKVIWSLGRRYYHTVETFPLYLSVSAIYASKKVEHLYNERGVLKNILLELLSKESKNIFFAMEVIYLLIIDSDKFIIPKKDLEGFNYNYFKKDCERKVIDSQLNNYYDHCVIYDPSNTTSYYSVNTNAQDLLRRHVKKYFNECDFGVLIQEASFNSNKFQLNDRLINKYFKSNEDFKNFFDEGIHLNKSSKCYIEMKNFLDELSSQDEGVIKFEFQELKPQKWLQSL